MRLCRRCPPFALIIADIALMAMEGFAAFRLYASGTLVTEERTGTVTA